MSGGKPRLVALEDRSGAPPAREAASQEAANGRPSAAGRRVAWALGVLLVLALIGLGLQTRRVGELSGQVATLTADLGQARSALVAYQSQLDEVRTSVADLQTRFAALDALVNRDPTAVPRASRPGTRGAAQ